MRVVWTGSTGVVNEVVGLDGGFDSLQETVVENFVRVACRKLPNHFVADLRQHEL